MDSSQPNQSLLGKIVCTLPPRFQFMWDCTYLLLNCVVMLKIIFFSEAYWWIQQIRRKCICQKSNNKSVWSSLWWWVDHWKCKFEKIQRIPKSNSDLLVWSFILWGYQRVFLKEWDINCEMEYWTCLSLNTSFVSTYVLTFYLCNLGLS